MYSIATQRTIIARYASAAPSYAPTLSEPQSCPRKYSSLPPRHVACARTSDRGIVAYMRQPSDKQGCPCAAQAWQFANNCWPVALPKSIISKPMAAGAVYEPTRASTASEIPRPPLGRYGRRQYPCTPSRAKGLLLRREAAVAHSWGSSQRPQRPWRGPRPLSTQYAVSEKLLSDLSRLFRVSPWCAHICCWWSRYM